MPILYVLVIIVAGIVLLSYLSNKNQAAENVNVTTAPSWEAYVTEAQFQQMVLDTSNEKPILVDFYADWCGPCQAFTPILSELANEYQGAFLLAKVDVDKNPDLAQHYQVKSMPCVMIFKNAECIESFSGGKLPHALRYLLAQNDIQPNQEP